MRRIKFADVREVILNGEIIEQVLNDYPNPSIVILGYTNNQPLHIVIGVDNDKLWLITAYSPAINLWEDDRKTRKE
jgi:uncharacterized DUF497 family protein